MEEAYKLMRDLLALGVMLCPWGANVRYDAKQGVVTEEHKARIRKHKKEILIILNEMSNLPPTRGIRNTN